MNKRIVVLVLMLLFSACGKEMKQPEKDVLHKPEKKEVLLIGTFHYNNPGADVAKTKSFNILNEKSQLELQEITAAIKDYNPTKIFVEWPYYEQEELDSLYQLYLEGQYFERIDDSEFYLKNEIFQLAFRAGKANDINKIYAIDYSTSFPFEEVMKDIEKNSQNELKARIENGISSLTSEIDNRIESGNSLIELTQFLNSRKFRKLSNTWHNDLMLLAGNAEDFSGPLLTAEWFKRNLYMWSMIQKHTTRTDEKIMVLVGASHAAMLALFMNEHDTWKIKELEEIMRK